MSAERDVIQRGSLGGSPGGGTARAPDRSGERWGMGDPVTDWYGDWQHQHHAVLFDGRAQLDRRNLVRNYEGFNDVRLLNERIDWEKPLTVFEVGCATGEFFRYLTVKHPGTRYCGADVSEAAIARAKEKYPGTLFFVTHPTMTLGVSLRTQGVLEPPEVVYAKDVIQHQTQPFEWLSQLIQIASTAVILRCRTRDVGQTEWNPELSCQYHYNGWMPYIVLNLQELIDHIHGEVSGCEVVIYRNRMILGGQNNRFVPKELYLSTTGTAETAVGVFKITGHGGRVTIEDRLDQNPIYTWDYLLRRALHRGVDVLRGRLAREGGGRSLRCREGGTVAALDAPR